MRWLITSLTLVFLFLSAGSFGQDYSKRAIKLTDQAEVAVAQRQFEAAIDLLGKAMKVDPSYPKAPLRLAGIYQILRQLDSTLVYYQKYVALVPESAVNERLWIRIAELSAGFGAYEEAAAALSHVANPPERLHQQIQFSLKAIQNTRELKMIELPDAINRFQFQYFPVLTVDENTIIYTKRDSPTQSSDEDMVISSRIGGEWIPAQSISGSINTQFNEGACTISADGNTLIFTACVGRESLGSCDLYITNRRGNRWSEPKNMGPKINTQYWDSQPSLSADGRVLYFASTRPGGLGKRDIWVAKFDGAEWGSPVNLGKPVNTPFDDTTPFIHANNSVLFFSSEGHIGLGGFDLFYSERKDTVWSEPVNLSYPINTHGDEISLFVNASGDRGYFAKEEKEGGVLTESRLYQVDLPFDTLLKHEASYVTGRVMDAESRQPIEALLRMTNLTDTTDRYVTHSDPYNGRYFLVLTSGREFGVFIEKQGYLFEDLKFVTRETDRLKPDTLDIYLRPVKAGESLTLENIYFETDKYTLDPRSLTELQEIVQFLKANPRLFIEVQGHTDNQGDSAYNKKLAENRARTVQDYLWVNGIEKTRVKSEGYGEQRPLASNETEAGREKNRRIEFLILAND